MNKILFSVLFFILSYTNVNGQDFYSKASGNPNALATWGTNTDGTGTAPINFTTASQVFNLRNSNPGTLTANWTISGAGSKVIVGDGSFVQTLSTAAFTIIGTFDVQNLGTLSVQSASTFTLGTCASGSTVNYSFDGTQSVIIGTYHHLTLNNASAARTKTATGAITVNGDLSVTTNNTFALTTFQLSTVAGTISGNGTITTTSTSSTPIPAGKTWTQNITYSSANSQTVPKGVYTGTLNVAGAAGARVFPTGGDTVEVRGNFTANASSITYTTTGTRFIFSGNAQTLTFVSTSAFNFGSVFFTGSNVTKTIAGAGFSVDTINVSSTVTLNMVTFAMGGTINLSIGNGVIQTQTATSAVPNNKTWAQNFIYDLDNTQSIIGGIYPNITVAILNTARTKTATGNITVNNEIALTSTGSGALAFNMSTFQLINGGSFVLTNTGTAAKNITTNYTNTDTAFKPLPVNQTWPSSVTYSSASHQTVVSGIYPTILLVAGGSRTFSAIGIIEVRGNFTANTASTTYIATNSSFLFSGAAQTLTFISTSPFNFNNISFTGTSITKTIATAGFGANGILNVGVTTTLNMGTFAMGGNPTNITGAGTILTQNTGLAPLPANKIWSQTVNFNGTSTQNISGGTFANLSTGITGNTARTKTALDSIIVNGNFSFTTTGTGVLTLAMGVFRLIAGSGFTLVNNGVALKSMTTNYTNADTAFTPIPNNQTWLGSVTYGSSFHQTVVAGVYPNTLLITGGNRTFLPSGTIEVRGAFTANLGIRTYVATGTTFLFSGAAQALTFISTSPLNFNNISFTGSGTKTIATFGFGVNGALNIASGVTLNMATLNMTGNPTTITGNGTILTQSTTAIALPLGETWTQTVNYNTNVNQSLIGGTYENLIISAVTSGTRTKTATGNVIVNDSFTLNASGSGIITLQMLAFKLEAGPFFVFINIGTTNRNINTQCLDTVPIPSNITWPFAGLINYNAASGTQMVSKGIYKNLTLSGNSSKIAEGNLTVRGVLTLTSPNASSTRGSLHMGSDTLLMDSVVASFAGSGDVSGIVKRTGQFAANTQYTFGNLFTQIRLSTGGNPPTEISMRITLGSALTNKPNSITRQYEISQFGGTDTAIIQFKYLVSELNGILETRLVVWEDSLGTVLERGRSAINTTSKFVEKTGILMSNYGSTFGSTFIGFAATAQPQIIWVGATSASWNTTTNWNPTFIPDSTDDVIIPDSSTTTFDPTLPTTARVKTISIDANSVLNAVASAQLFVYGGTTSGLSSWDCNGLFNPGTSTVNFLGTDATFAGITNFYNINITDTAVLSNRESSVMRIGNAITNTGIWRVAAFNETTVEYNNLGNQTILRPNGISVSGYFNLITSGTGTKTLPDSVNIKGDFTTNGAISNTSIVTFDGNIDQRIGGTSAATFGSLRVANGQSVFLDNNLTISDSLDIANGILNLNNNALTLSGIVKGGGTFSSTATSNITLDGSGNLGIIAFAPNNDSVNNITINRTFSGIVNLGSNMIVAGNLTVTAGRFQIGNNDLTLLGNFSGSGSGTLSGNDSLTQLNILGSGAIDSLFFDQTTPNLTNRIGRLLYDRPSQTIALGNALQVTHEVVPASGTLATGGNLTLLSTASRTAYIADGGCTTCSYITGNVIVQRHIPSVARRWRFLGSPVAANTIADWQGEVYITGPGGASNGFDATLSNFAGIFSYNESSLGNLNTGWTVPTSSSQAIGLGKGYRVFVRGDRSDSGRLTGTVTTQNAVTIDTRGVPNQGNITMPVSCTFSDVSGTVYNDANDGWNLLSNPYASPYDWNAHFDAGINNTNIESRIWILNAQTNGYDDYNAISNAGQITNGIIPSGASFWVKANGALPTLTFKEEYKATEQQNNYFKTSDGETFSIRLIFDSITSDGLRIKYTQDANDNYDLLDTRKLAGSINVSAFGNDSIQLSLTVRPVTFDIDTVKLRVNGAAGNYKLIFTNGEEIAIRENVLLFDTYLSTVTDLKTTNMYSFSMVSGVAASSGLSRFYIIVGNSSIVPVKLLHFTARKTGAKQVSLKWSVAQEVNNEKFVIERSENGTNFEPIGSINGNGTASRVINYSFEDLEPKRINYYRLKQLDFDGTAHYSIIQLVNLENIETQKLQLFPIPAKETMTVSLTKTITALKIIDLIGNTVLQLDDNNSNKLDVNIIHLPQGIYVISVTDLDGISHSEKFIKE